MNVPLLSSRSNIRYKPANDEIANKESLRSVKTDFAKHRRHTHPKRITYAAAAI